jgi:hypothetical protein
MISGNIGKYFIQIDPSKNATEGRIINRETGESVIANFADEYSIFTDVVSKYPVVIETKDQTIIDNQKEIDSLKAKLAFFEDKINLSVKDYDQYKTL